jgi:hypothetical protein
LNDKAMTAGRSQAVVFGKGSLQHLPYIACQQWHGKGTVVLPFGCMSCGMYSKKENATGLAAASIRRHTSKPYHRLVRQYNARQALACRQSSLNECFDKPLESGKIIEGRVDATCSILLWFYGVCPDSRGTFRLVLAIEWSRR